jgi:hypothetical protein
MHSLTIKEARLLFAKVTRGRSLDFKILEGNLPFETEVNEYITNLMEEVKLSTCQGERGLRFFKGSSLFNQGSLDRDGRKIVTYIIR